MSHLLDIDLYGPTVLADPLPHYAALRDAGPAVWLPRNKLWAVARHADVKTALRDAETFRSGAGVGANRLINRLSRHTVLNSDGDVHTARRRVLLRSVGPRHLTDVEEPIRERAEALVARLLAAPGFDGVTDFATALPVEVVADLVGLRVDAARLLHWGRTTFDALGPTNRRSLRAAPSGLGLARRTARLSHSDVVPGTWAAAVFAAAEAGDISEREARTMVIDFVVPSLDTTILAAAHLLWCLGTVPGAWEALRADPGLIPAAVVEAVRLASPVRGFTRLVARDTDIDGVRIRAGQRVVLLYAAANRDERAFDRPDEFDLHRARHDQLGWGKGPHTCVGMHLAKLEMTALLRAMVPAVGGVRLGLPTLVVNNVLQGFATLPARFLPNPSLPNPSLPNPSPPNPSLPNPSPPNPSLPVEAP